eukprot:6192826-Pleurochrysis_carterae.AAC.1
MEQLAAHHALQNDQIASLQAELTKQCLANARQQALLLQADANERGQQQRTLPAAQPPCRCTSCHNCTPTSSHHAHPSAFALSSPHGYGVWHNLNRALVAVYRSKEVYARVEYEDLQRQIMLHAKTRFEIARNG